MAAVMDYNWAREMETRKVDEKVAWKVASTVELLVGSAVDMKGS